MRLRQAGFTLIELLVTVALVALLASLAVPNFRSLLVKRSVQAAADAMVSDLRFARSEALKRSAAVSMCRSADGAACSGAAGLWKDGWIVFVDANANGSYEAGDEIVRVQQGLSSIASIASTNPASDRSFFVFYPTGWSKSASQSFIFTPTGSVPLNSTRLLCISNQGRPGLKSEGSTACA